jgi:glyoxylase-like metal-dependent hydrolase (beta-lactamase superfamily II)
MAHTYSFAIGNFDCTVISDGLSEADVERVKATFPDVPADEVEAEFNKIHGEGGICQRSMSMLLVETDERTILFDTGLGTGGAVGGGLFEGLEEIGVDPADIDTVVISHCHGDHINGIISADGDMSFPNASYFISEIEWNHNMGPDGTARKDDDYGKSLMSKLGPLEGSITCVKDGDSLMPGIKFLLAPGHTPGHMAIEFESEDENLLYLVDAIHFQIQLSDLNRSPRFDWNTDQSVPTRERLVARAADENLLTLTYHFPFPGVGRFTRRGDAFDWGLELDE